MSKLGRSQFEIRCSPANTTAQTKGSTFNMKSNERFAPTLPSSSAKNRELAARSKPQVMCLPKSPREVHAHNVQAQFHISHNQQHVSQSIYNAPYAILCSVMQCQLVEALTTLAIRTWVGCSPLSRPSWSKPVRDGCFNWLKVGTTFTPQRNLHLSQQHRQQQTPK